jgi:V-type H+-transporting ATPase subunit E
MCTSFAESLNYAFALVFFWLFQLHPQRSSHFHTPPPPLLLLLPY